jgi:hypothetical protein
MLIPQNITAQSSKFVAEWSLDIEPVTAPSEVHQRADELVASLFGPAAQQLDLLPDVGMLGPTSAPSPPLPRCYGDRRMPHPTVYGQP